MDVAPRLEKIKPMWTGLKPAFYLEVKLFPDESNSLSFQLIMTKKMRFILYKFKMEDYLWYVYLLTTESVDSQSNELLLVLSVFLKQRSQKRLIFKTGLKKQRNDITVAFMFMLAVGDTKIH